MSSPSLGYASLGGTNNHNANTMEIIQASLRIWNIQGLPVFPTSFPSLPRDTKKMVIVVELLSFSYFGFFAIYRFP